MLAANLTVCHYPGMPSQNSGGNIISGTNHNLNTANDINSSVGNNSNISSNLNSNSVSSPSAVVCVNSVGITAVATKNQLEQLNTMREALFAQDGWGCQHVNQDTNWEVPSSPEPTIKDPSASLWKPNINNGTELWESTLRNGGQPTLLATQKTPWGHTPSSNLGGTWGEEDDGLENNSVWNGASANSMQGSSNVVAGLNATNISTNLTGGSQWTHQNSSISNKAGASIQTLPAGPNGQSTGVPVGNQSSWVDSRASGTSNEIRNIDPRDQIRASSAGDPRDLRLIDTRDPIRGDPRGISGRLNGSSEMWGQHHSVSAHNHQPISGLNKIVGQGGASTSIVQSSNLNNVMNSSIASGSTIGPPGTNNITAASGTGNSQWGTGWDESSPPTQRRNIPPNYDDGTALWGGQQQQNRVANSTIPWKDLTEVNLNNRPSHNLRNSVSNQNSQNLNAIGPVSGVGAIGIVNSTTTTVMNNNLAPLPSTGNRIGVPTSSSASSSISSGQSGSHKQDTTAIWLQQSNNLNSRSSTGWDDTGAGVSNHNTNWIDDKSSNSNPTLTQLAATNINSWNDSTTWGKNTNKMTATGWNNNSNINENDIVNNVDWNQHGNLINKPPPSTLQPQHQQQPQQAQISSAGTTNKLGNIGPISSINADIIKQSKQYRFLVESGFKKDDVERALIFTNMNIEEAAELLRSNNTYENWRRQDDPIISNAFMDSNSAISAGGLPPFPTRYNGSGPQSGLNYPQGNILNNLSTGAGGHIGGSIQIPKYNHNIAGTQSMNSSVGPFGQGSVTSGVSAMPVTNPINVSPSTASNNQPSTHQLRMLVQQIQMAVHNGYLSSQILNQPLAPTTLVLLNQLLSSIKHLQAAQQTLSSRSNNSNNLQINVAIAKHKQQIQSLQNQINMQQTNYIKQQQQNQSSGVVGNVSGQSHVANTISNDFLRGGALIVGSSVASDSINNLQSTFTDVSINKSSNFHSNSSNQQSRLNQWKLPSLDKDECGNTEFSRAPGASKQPLNNGNNNSTASSSSHISLTNECTWSTNRNIGDGWPDVAAIDSENKDWSVAPSTAAATYGDLVQEFEPGKPWKGSQIKTIEDDPSMTPGSVVRSPLSINPGSSKDSEIFSTVSKSSPNDLTPIGLVSSTWSFNPPSAHPPTFSSWSEPCQQSTTSELWANQMNKPSRGPPPGLVSSNKGGPLISNSSSMNAGCGSHSSNNWILGGNRGISGNWTSGTTSNSTWNSSWLLLKNLTNQIDGSTLRTLCMQHGQPVSFHLYLNQGFALCKYATYEEASKAQMTLNNCVLSNTTICAESPSESEVQHLMKHLQPSVSSSSVAQSGSITQTSNTNNNSNANAIVNNSNSNSMNPSTSSAPNNSSTNSLNDSGSCGSATGQSSSNMHSITNAAVGSSCTTSIHTNWRQHQNQPQQQPTLSRSAGRETDFDYISKFVCSIVDD